MTARPSPCARTAPSTAPTISALVRPSWSMSGPDRNRSHSSAGSPRCVTGPGRPAASAGSALGRLVQEQVADRRRVDAAYVLRPGRQVVVEVPEDDRRLIQQQGLDLAGDLLLRGDVNGADVLRGELV